MRTLSWLLRAALFFVLFGFAIKNDALVTVRAYFGAEWRLPLVVVMLVMLVCGVLLGASAVAGTVFRLRRELARAHKRLAAQSPSTRMRNRSGQRSDSL